MHDTMWANPILKRNLETLKAAGYTIIPPKIGLQTTGDVGEGRMAGMGAIIAALTDSARPIPSKEQE